MADDPLIMKALDQIAVHEAEVTRLKLWVNDADKLSGLTPRFDDVTSSPNSSPGSQHTTVKRWQPKPGELLGKPFSTAVRNILLARYDAASDEPSPATIDEIHEAMTQGSFAFETSGNDSQKAGIRISLGKNTAAFVRLPNTDLFGLLEWYPGLKRAGKSRAKLNGDSASSGEGAGDEEAAGDAAAGEASIMEGR